MNFNRVAWTEGLFVGQQHFQQQDRYHDERYTQLLRFGQEWYWGFADLNIDETACMLGKVKLSKARGVLRDGCMFDCPQSNALPAALDVPANTTNELVYLALPLEDAGRASQTFEPTHGHARYHVQAQHIHDAFNIGNSLHMQTLDLNLQLLLERDLNGAWLALPIAMVCEKRADGFVVLDPGFIAPALRCAAQAPMVNAINELTALTRQRAISLAARIQGDTPASVSDVADFLMLLTLNRHLPTLEQMLERPQLAFAEFFFFAQQMAGELATLTREERMAVDIPKYDHDHPALCLPPLMHLLRQYLTQVFEQSAIAIELVPRQHGIKAAHITDPSLLDNAHFVLAAKAHMSPSELCKHLPAHTRIGPSTSIDGLMRAAVSGIRIAALPAVPKQIPFHAGFNYFELEKDSELWAALRQTGNMSLHVAGDFKGLELELWAIRTTP